MFVTDDRVTEGASSGMTEALAKARQLASTGNIFEAIDFATTCNRVHRNVELERLLVQWRSRAFACMERSSARNEWPPHYPDLLDNHAPVPEITRDQLSTGTLAAGILHHGSLLVRGLLDPSQAASLVEGIDLAFSGAEAQHAAGYEDAGTTPWYSRFPLPSDDFVSMTRPWVESAGGVLLADSPRMMFEFAEVLEQIGILPVIERYLGERPTLSIAKSTLRRVPKTLKLTGWHQDGSFLGKGIRSVNLWLCLSHCGETASGLDLLPKRLNHIVETGTHGAMLDWSVGEGMVEIASEGTPIVTPVFKPGDAMLFDEMLLHRTGIPAQMLHDRYAIESWFFAPSSYPMAQKPLVL